MAESPLDGTLLKAQLDEAKGYIDRANVARENIAGTLVEWGATGVDTSSSIEAIDPALEKLLKSLTSETSTVVTFVVNPTGSEYYLPADPTILAAATNGAYIQIQEIDTERVWRIPLTSLQNFAVNFVNTFSKDATRIRARVVCGASGEAIQGRWQVAVIVNRKAVTITLTTYLSDNQTMEVGRVFPVDAQNPDSFPIVATTANGVRTELFGRYAANGEWISETGYHAAVPEFDPETGTVASWANGPAERSYEKELWPWNAARRVTFKATDAAGTILDLEMAGFDRKDFYGIKWERRDIVFPSIAADGTESSVTRDCYVLWIARPTMPGYTIPSTAYLKAWEAETSGTGERKLTMELLDGIYAAAHKANTVNLAVPNDDDTGTIVKQALNTGTIGSIDTSISCENAAAAAWTLNRCSLLDPRDTEAPITLEADPTNRRFAASNLDTYCYFLPLFVVEFGIDSQSVIMGVSSDKSPQTKAGTTDPIVEAGYLTGVWGAAQDNVPFVWLGIENFGYGSEGEPLCDLSWFTGRDEGETANRTEAWVQPDRSAYSPNTAERSAIAAVGYLHADTKPTSNTITFLRAIREAEGISHLWLPCSSGEENINAKGCDTTELYAIGAGEGKFALSNATISRYRSHGRSLGVVALGWIYGRNAPGSANGADFGARVTLALRGAGDEPADAQN